jgi:hypothetical protein
MPNNRTIRTSFVGGEVAPELYGRLDLEKEQSGLAACRNFIILPAGPAQNRAGFRFVAAVKNAGAATRLLPFSFSNTQTFALEMGAGYFRFHTLGENLMCGAGPGFLGPAYSASTYYGVGALASYGGGNYYCLTPCTGVAPPNGAYWYAMPAGGAYEIPHPFAASELFDVHYVQSGDVLTLTHPGHPPLELRRYANLQWVLAGIAFQSTIPAPAAPSVTATAGYTTGWAPQNFQYAVTALDAFGEQESLVSPASATVSNDLAISASNFNSISWSGVTGASVYNVYKSFNGAFGYIGQVVGTAFTDHNITPDFTQTPPLQDVVFAGPGDYPAAVGLYEQRRFFGGTGNQPENLWGSQPGAQSNMDYSIPAQASDALRVTIAAQRANVIRHFVALLDLIVLTASTEWRVFTASGDALTPTTITIKSQAQNGASNVQPVLVNNTCVYAASQGGHLRSLTYDWQLNGYRSDDLCLLATHLFNYHTVVDLAFSRSPYPLIWAVNEQGLLLGCTYLPDQQVSAWHRHSTVNGFFESACTVTEGNFDVLYAVVRRLINGQTVRYIEVLDTRAYAGNLSNAFFVDCGLSYSNAMNYLTGMQGFQATAIITAYTQSRLQMGSMQLSFAVSYNYAFTGTLSGHVAGVADTSLYRVDVYSTTDIDYLQGSSPLAYDFSWSVAGAHVGGKTARLVRIADGLAMTEAYFGNGLVRSYQVPPNAMGYFYLKDRCYLYDQALAICMAVVNRSGAANALLPGLLLDGLKLALDGGIASTTSYALGSQPVCFSVNYKSGIPPDIYVRSGATAWVLYALSFYAANITDPSRTWIAAYIDLVATQLLSYQLPAGGNYPGTVTPINPLQAGALCGGVGLYNPPYYTTFTNTTITWCSTEHNIDAYFALTLAGTVRGNASYTAAAATIGSALAYTFWNYAAQMFYQGIDSTGPDSGDALDCHTLGSLFLRYWGDATKAGQAYAGIAAYAVIDPNTGVAGYTPYLASRGYPGASMEVWGEGSLQVVLARVAAGDLTRAEADYQALLATAGPFGLPYATLRDTTYELADWPSVASTAWMMLAMHPGGFLGVSTAIDTALIASTPTLLNAPTQTLSGLGYLQGQTVAILADGVAQPQQVVPSSGAITLDYPASIIQVGLPITATLETLPIALAGDASLGQGRVKNVNQVWARCVDFTGCQVGPDQNTLVSVKPLAYQADGITPQLTNGEFRMNIMPAFTADGGVVISNSSPVPLTVCDVTLEVAFGG